MLEGIFKLLKLEVVLAMTLAGLLLKAAIWLARLLTRLIPNKSHLPSRPQPEILAPTPTPVQKAATAPVAAPRQPQPSPPVPTPLSSGGRTGSRTAAVLEAVDHGIWVAGSDDFVTPHPRAADLLEQLDKMMLVAAHRNGDPFTIPSLDRSPQALESLPAPHLDDGFDHVPLTPLPQSDGEVWILMPGSAASRLPPRQAPHLARTATT